MRGREVLCELLGKLPPQTSFVTQSLLDELDHLQTEVEAIEGRMIELFGAMKGLDVIQTLPGVAFILEVVILTEVGDV